MKPTRLHKALILMGAMALAAPLAPAPGVAPGAGAASLPSFSDVVKEAKPAVVTVRVEAGARMGRNMPGMPFDDPQLREFFERFFGGVPEFPRPGPGDGPRRQGLGSGFIIDASGLIVTNNHVVEGAENITVILEDGTEIEAELIGVDEKTDLAVLRIDAGRGLPTVPWGDSDRIEVGDWVVAIGNPFGFGGTVTAGIVSARGRNLHSGPYDDFIQFDAPINRGNSGGPLFDQEGRVIGVNTAIFSPSGGNVGVGFAIPSNQARKVATALIEEGRVERGWVGVSIQPVTREIAESLGLDEARGALVASVEPDGPAARAGIRAGDVILGFGGTRIEVLRDLTTAVADTAPGREAEVRVWRAERTETVTVEIGRMPGERKAARPAPRGGPDSDLAALGLKVRPGEGGLEVTGIDPSSDAAAKGLQPGDLIVAANQEPVRSLDDLDRVLAQAREASRRSVLLLVARDGSQRFVTVQVGAV
ncbi:MAG TPA: DegQ family serine endoprotease [Thermohalobaculum sp.]|nr:DegQ family serine endoprotease [Thermohalobaculum sp.]